MYSPKCKEERSGNFCHICSAKLVESRQVDAQINIGDGNAIKDFQFHHQVNNVSNVTNNIVERQKTAEEQEREAEEQFAQLCKEVFKDGILTEEERNLLESKQLELGLSDEKAERFIEQFRGEANNINKGLAAPCIALLDHIDALIKGNKVAALIYTLQSLKKIVAGSDNARAQFLYYMLLAAIKPEELIKEYEGDIENKYWRTYWVYIAYQKNSEVDKSYDAIEKLNGKNEDNCRLLDSIDKYHIGELEVASNLFQSIVPELCDYLLREFVKAMSVAISPENAEDINKYKFYIDNIITFESRAEEEARLRAEEEAMRKAEEEAMRRAAEEAKRKAPAEAKSLYELGKKTNCISQYKKSASLGYAPAQFELAKRYELGKGVWWSLEKAAEWYRKAAEQGHTEAQYKLGSCYEYGFGVSKSYTVAAEWYRKAAEQGDTGAQYKLGSFYENGYGVSKSYTVAAEWYRKAAEQGLADAQNKLGICYAEGQGVQQSYEEAAKWYTLAAEQGGAYAQDNLGICYELGQGVQQSYEEAAKWYRKAAEQGHEKAKQQLGLCEDKINKGQKRDDNKEESLEKSPKNAVENNPTPENDALDWFYGLFVVIMAIALLLLERCS